MKVGQNVVVLVCKAVALGMGVVSVMLNIVGEASVETSTALLGIGLFALAVASLQKTG